MFVFKDMDDYENRGENVDVEYTKMMAAAEKAGLQLYLGSYPITPATDILHELLLRLF